MSYENYHAFINEISCNIIIFNNTDILKIIKGINKYKLKDQNHLMNDQYQFYYINVESKKYGKSTWLRQNLDKRFKSINMMECLRFLACHQMTR